jgi:hypothetical protein
MNAFRFRLERILHWRITSLKVEEARLEHIRFNLEVARAEREKLASAFVASKQSTGQQVLLRGADLHALDSYEGRLRTEIALAIAKMASLSEAIAKQSLVVSGCDRNVRLLERLRARRRLDWQKEANRELDELASDFSAGQWLRQKRDASRTQDSDSTTGPDISAAR